MPIELLRYEILLPAFALVLARMAGVVWAVPFLTSQQIPSIVKAWLIVTLSLMAFPVVAPLLPRSLTLGQAGVGMVGEFIVGEVMGLGAGLVLAAAQVAGKMVSHQSALAIGEEFNPLMDEPTTVLDQVWFFGVLMFFLALRGHLAVVNVLLNSFHKVPPMMMTVDGALGEYAIGIMRSTFDLALRMCGPVMVALLLTSLILGLLTRTMPQLNILSVGFGFKVLTALFILGITASYSGDLIAEGITDGLDQVGKLLDHTSRTLGRGVGVS